MKKMFKAVTVLVLSFVLSLGFAAVPAGHDVFAVKAEATVSWFGWGETKEASSTKNSVTFEWDDFEGATSYRILRYNPSKKKFQKVKDVKGTKVTINKLKPGTKYNFKVIPLKNNKELEIDFYPDGLPWSFKTKGGVKSSEASKALKCLGKYFDDLPKASDISEEDGELCIFYRSHYNGNASEIIEHNNWEECEFLVVSFTYDSSAAKDNKYDDLVKQYRKKGYTVEEEDSDLVSKKTRCTIYDEYGEYASITKYRDEDKLVIRVNK